MTVCSSRHNCALMPVAAIAAIAAVTLALSASLFSSAHASSVPADPQSEDEWAVGSEEGKWRPYIELQGRMSDDGSLGQADVFLPLAQNLDSLLFFNLRGHTNFSHQGEFNIGLGYRHKFDNWILGGYGYLDQSKGDRGQRYRQATFGVEALGEHWDLRFNGYLPEEQAATSFGQVVINANQISVDVHLQKALRGVDGEVGLRIGGRNPEHRAGAKLPSNDLRFYAGGYHFEEDGDAEAITGGRFRAEWGFDNLPRFGDGSRFSIGVETQYDESRGSRTAGLVRLRLPLGTGDLKDNDGNDDCDAASYAAINSGLDRRMVTPVVRDVDIVVGSGQANVAALNPAGQVYQQYLEYHSRDDLEIGTDHNQTSGNDDDGRKAEDEVILVNMIGGEDDVANWHMTKRFTPSTGWQGTRFATVGGGVSYTLAGKDTPIGFDNPFTGLRGKTSFVPNGVTPDLSFEYEDITASKNSMFDLSAGDHINGWDLDASTDSANGTFRHGLLVEQTGPYYVTNSKFSNALRSGLRVDPANSAATPELYV